MGKRSSVKEFFVVLNEKNSSLVDIDESSKNYSVKYISREEEEIELIRSKMCVEVEGNRLVGIVCQKSYWTIRFCCYK